MANRRVREAKKRVRQDVIDELLRLAGDDGLKPSFVVQEARNKKSPLHAEFEWDDAKAGHEYRLAQARRLIRLAVPEVDGRPDPFVHVPPAANEQDEDGGTVREGAYYPTSVVVANTDWFARALTELQAKVRAAQRAAESLKDAAVAHDDSDGERMAKIAMAIQALQTAGAAVSALH